jgi:hypothetical protein
VDGPPRLSRYIDEFDDAFRPVADAFQTVLDAGRRP